MSAIPPLTDATGTEYEEMPARSGASGWLFFLFHFALGAVTVGLAVSSDFARDKATFANDASRAAFGIVGAGLMVLALRAMVRALRDERPRLTPQLFQRGKAWGRVLVAVGLVFVAVGTVDALGDVTVGLSGWANPFYICGGVYLTLMGSVLQWNPTRHIRQQRVARGQGRPGVVRILRASDTGVSVNDAPQVKIEFELEVGGRTHLVSDKIVMERAKLALLIPGSTMNALVDNVDPNVFHIDWDSWKAPAG